MYNLTSDTTWTYANFGTRLNGEFWIKYELPEAQSVDLIDLAARRGGESNRMSTWFKVEGSNDDTNWTTILERASLGRWYNGESRQYWIDSPTTYKFYRLISIEQPVGDFALSRFRLYKKVDGIRVWNGFIPALSSASQAGYEISASSQYASDHAAFYAFDDDISTRWATVNGGGIGGWIQIKFPTETLCTTAWLTARNDSYYDQAATDFTILGSVDGVNFETLKTVTGQSWNQGEQKIFDFTNTVPYLYYRIEAVDIQGSDNLFALSKVNFGTRMREYRRELNVDRRLTPIMTADSQNGFVVTASSIYSGQRVYSPYLAFNNSISDSDSWTTQSQSGWIQIELPEADKAEILKMSGGFSSEEPDSFVLYGSNDGETYTQLLSSGALTWSHNETKTWNLNNNTAYKFYKIEAVNTKSAYITISEIQLIEHITTREY